jgi:hypothetical protein
MHDLFNAHVPRSLGLVLGVKQSEQVIAKEWQSPAIQHSRGCERNSELFPLAGSAFLRSGMGDAYRVFRRWIVYGRLGAPGAPGQNSSRA